METAIGVVRGLTAQVADVTLRPPPSIFGVLAAEAQAWHAAHIARSPELYQPSVRRSLTGAAQPARSYVDGLRAIQQARRDVVRLFESVDLLVTPTMARPAERHADSASFGALGLRNTAPFDAYGLPTISLPCGFTRSGLPIGLQISGAPFAESKVLALAHAYEQATSWRQRRPRT